MDRSPAVAVLVWLACALAGACSLGVIALERAAEPVRGVRAVAPRVALVELGVNRIASDTLAFWERAARAANLRAEHVVAEHLAEVPPERFSVWLLAEQENLSEADWSELDAFAGRGGGVVLTDLAGVRDTGGGVHERLPLRRLFPGHRFELRDGSPAALTAGARGPLSAGLVPGEAIALAAGGPFLATHTGGALFWGEDREAGAVLVGLHRSAPAVWIGCPPGWIASPARAEELARNALRYAAREALVESLAPGDPPGAARAIRSELETPREGEIQVRAHNEGAATATDVTLRIYLPVGAPRPALQRVGWFAARPLVRYASGRAWMELVVAELDPGASVEYTLLF